MSFADQIKAFERKALLAANSSVLKAFETVAIDTVLLTPTSPEAKYATGLLINSWYPAVGSFDNTVGTTTDYYGNASLARIKAIVAQQPFLGKDNFITLTNSVDHAYRAEHLGWPSGLGTNGWHWTGKVQAYKMVGRAVNNLKGKYM